jgi:transposase
MLIGRCAWHLLYYGHPRWHGVTSWRGFTVRFTDGICPRCLERFREEHHARLVRRPAAVAPALTAEEVTT